MQVNALKENQWFQEVFHDLENLDQKKRKMEADFKPNMMDEYTDILKEHSKKAAEILKFGFPTRQVKDDIVIDIDDKTHITVDSETLKSTIGLDQYNLLVNKTKVEKVNKKEGVVENVEGIKESPAAPTARGSAENTPQTRKDQRDDSSVLLGNVLAAVIQSVSTGKNFEMPEEVLRASALKRIKSKSAREILTMLADLQKQIILMDAEHNEDPEAVILARKETKAVQKQLDRANNELSDKQIEVASLKKKIEQLESSVDSSKNDEWKKKYDALNVKLTAANTQISDKQKELSQLKKQLDDAKETQKSAEQKAERLDLDLKKARESQQKRGRDNDSALQKRIGELEKSLKDANIRADRAEDELKSVRSQNSEVSKTLEDENRRLKTQIADLKKSSDKANSLASENQSLRNENKSLKNEKSRLQDELDSVDDKDAQIKELSQSVYNDAFTSTKNQAAFDRDFENSDLEDITLSRIGICYLKDENRERGYQAGDNMVRTVADALSLQFDESAIYRIWGGQFAVITHGTTEKEISKAMKAVSDDLINNNNIYISYGVTDGKGYDSAEQLRNDTDIKKLDMEREILAQFEGDDEDVDYEDIPEQTEYSEQEDTDNNDDNSSSGAPISNTDLSEADDSVAEALLGDDDL